MRAAPRLRRGRAFQPKDLVWLDSCDKHRNEEFNKRWRVFDLNRPEGRAVGRARPQVVIGIQRSFGFAETVSLFLF
ncbi:hypothetical protein CN070_25045 [Sinorhizobium meliloti]|nr:hypothetical protein CN070_25045 [Sinorhizobium meliloti]